MNRRQRFLFIGTAPLAAAVALFACSDDDPRQRFEEKPDAVASLPEAAAPLEDEDGGVVDARAPEDAADEPLICTAKPCVTQLASGRNHFCALLDDKTVRCWGSGYRALGIYDGGNESASYRARPISMGLSGVEQISAANLTTCARLTNGTVTCWGASQANELGLDPPARTSILMGLPPSRSTAASSRASRASMSARAGWYLPRRPPVSSGRGATTPTTSSAA